MEEPTGIESEAMLTKTHEGRDELNLAEFPLCALAHRLRPEQKTLQYEDQVWDQRRGRTVTRQLTISGSDAYGLPTALDDDVLLGLIQLTRLQQFVDRKVLFTRYQLIQLLGWRNETKSYERIEASLNRWTGVTLYYRNAWWNRSKGCWVDEKFHVLDNVWLCHRADPASEAGEGPEGAPRSAFVWNETVFRSFKSGNLKSIDFDFFKELESAIAKRLYRFLDKRFFRRRRCEFDLKELGWEHTGLSRGYDPAGLKRKLTPAINELVKRGYLEPMPGGQRFRKVCSGEWSVVFERATGKPLAAAGEGAKPEEESLAAALIERGVTPATARRTVAAFPAQEIKTQVEAFDWMRARQDPKVSRNPPGFLVSAIKQGYTVPRGFVGSEELTRRAEAVEQSRRQVQEREQARAAEQSAREAEQARLIAQFWAALPATERAEAEAQALSGVSHLHRSFIRRGGRLGDSVRKAALDAYALAQIGRR